MVKTEAKSPRKARRSNSTQVDPTQPASIVINKFGGLGQMHKDTGYATSTLWGWARRGYIPNPKIPEIKAHAIRLKVKLKDSDFVPAAQAPAA